MKPGRKKRGELLLEVNRILYDKYGDCHCSLDYKNPLQLLVAVILSAQCTDVRVNKITPELFKKFPDAVSLAESDITELEEAIKSAGLFRNKAKSIKKAASSLVSKFNGIVPDTMEGLTSLAGVGRKTANVILGDAFGIPGLPVDTHVKRVLNRIGAVKSDNAEKIEAMVNEVVPPEYWTNLSHMVILHGRETCKARNPDCDDCILNHICAFYASSGRKRNN
ncbi:endonuclease III [Lentisphaerota bacterium ZTH]|nr:endonuclease III [Lentisphaerota bacterium]WET05674.1 endonuclease III [Lentisphaerota bacterium ZTH]